MNKSKNNIDTGKMIADYLIKNRIAKSDLGTDINRTGVAVLRYTYNSSIQTGILLDICHALKHNFFQELANQLPKDFTVPENIDTEKQSFDKSQQALIEQLNEENKVLKIQNELLMKIKT